MRTLLVIVCLLATTPSWAVYSPPTGIPAPSFGVDEVFPSEPVEWPGAVSTGWYFIDNSVSCTDTANANGYPNNPRCTIPSGTQAAGTKIVLGNGHIQTSTINRAWTCTSGNPCWMRSRTCPARSSTAKMRFKNVMLQATGDPAYLIVECVFFDGTDAGSVESTADIGCIGTAPGRYIVIRNSLFAGNGTSQGAGSAVAMEGCASTNRSNNLVVYNNEIRSIGDWTPSAAQNDFHGAKAGTNADQVWVIDNLIYHMGGDSVQMGTASTADENRVANIYIGRNVGYENHENFVDIKEADDVIISENVGYSMQVSATSGGTCAVAHNLSGWVWLINNIFYDCVVGFQTTGSTNNYVIGNLFYDLHDSPASVSGSCIRTRGSSPIVAVNNTCDEVDNGWHSETGTNPITGGSNIVTAIDACCYHIYVPSSSVAFSSINSDFWQSGSSAKLRHGGATENVATFITNHPGECTACIEANPSYVNAAARNYQLNAGSPAIDTGTEDAAYATFQTRYGRNIRTDILGTTRPQGGGWDMGAYEYVVASGQNASDTLSPSEVVGVSVSIVINETLTPGETIDSGQSTVTVRSVPNRRQPVTGGFMRQ